MWLCSWVMVAHAQGAAPKCETYFRSSFENNFCPPNAQCLIADNVNYTFYTAQNADYYFWNFGDGTSAIDSVGKVSHAYFKPGKYEVSHVAYYNVKTNNPCKAVYLETIVVKFPGDTISNSLCIANLQTSTSGLHMKAWDANQTITTDAMTQTIYFWNLGDGNKFASGNLNIGINYEYKKEGNYLVKMTKVIMKSYKSSEACDATMTVDSITIMTPCYQKEICRETYTTWVSVSNEVPPISNCNLKASVVVNGNSISYNSSRSIYWLKSDTSFITIPTERDIPTFRKTETFYYWTFGDGTDSAYSDKNSLISTHAHTYKKPGKYLVKLHAAQFYIAEELLMYWPDKYDSTLHSMISCYHMINCRSVDSVWVEVGPDVYPSCYAKANINVNNKSINYNTSPFWCGTTDTKDTSTVQHISLLEDTKTINYWSFGDGKDTVALNGTHTYAKPGKYLVILHSAKYFIKNPAAIQCLPSEIDSFLHTYIPCYYSLECRSTDSVWVEIGKENPFNKCLAITATANDITVNMALVYTADFKPGQFRHRYYNFGDGSDTMGVNQVTHTYKKDGKYLVTGTEITYYSAPMEVLAYTSYAPCTVPFYRDPSVRMTHSDCHLLEISRVSCSEWVTINTEKLVTSVYPNPANEFGNLHLENSQEKVDFMVYNAAGMLVKKIENVSNGTQQFDTSNMGSGLYLYTISKDGKILKRDKFAVNR